MKAHELIDRLASLDEAATVEEPMVEPGTIPREEPTQVPTRRPSRDPFDVPPDFEPGQMPRPKAEQESEQISGWLTATRQPLQDWEWDGADLRMLMDDGTTEVYNRRQLEEIGVFNGETAFAESFADEMGIGGEGGGGGESLYPEVEGPDPETVSAAIADEGVPNDEAAGTLDQILGRTSGGGGGMAEPGGGDLEAIPIEGDKAEELVTAVGDVVSAIIGLIGGEAGGGGEGGDEPKEGDDAPDKKKDKGDDKKSDKPKKEKKKSDDKDEDKETDKKDDDEKDDE